MNDTKCTLRIELYDRKVHSKIDPGSMGHFLGKVELSGSGLLPDRVPIDEDPSDGARTCCSGHVPLNIRHHISTHHTYATRAASPTGVIAATRRKISPMPEL